MRRVVLFLCLVALLGPLVVLPTAQAAGPPPCGRQETATVQGFHLRVTGLRNTVWHESNTLPGLQTATCVSGTRTVQADAIVAMVLPDDLGLLGLCFGVGSAFQCV